VKRVFVVFLLVLISSLSFAAEKWWNLPDSLSWSALPYTLYACQGTAGAYLNGKYYQICGFMSTNDYRYMQIYSGSSWTQSPTMHPEGIHNHSAAVCNGKIIVSGGENLDLPSGSYDYTTIYDPSGLTSWTQSTPMPQTSMSYTAMASANNICYLFGGKRGASFLSTTYEWTPGVASMTPKSDMPAPRRSMAVAECNGKIYAFGGCVENTSYNNIWEYNPSSNSWIVKTALLNTPRHAATAVTIGNKIYIIGGASNGSVILNTVEVYDVTNNTISSGLPLLYITAYHASAGYASPTSNTTYTGHIYVSGGTYIGYSLRIANLGTVTGVSCVKVEPASLGNIKAQYR